MSTLSREEAAMFLQLTQLYVSEPVTKARRFWRTIPDGLSFEQLRAKYPLDSDEFTHITTVIVFWEAIGLLLKHRLISDDLVFDSFLDSPPWPKIQSFFESLRAQEGGAGEGENFEIAYRRSLEWHELRTSRSV